MRLHLLFCGVVILAGAFCCFCESNDVEISERIKKCQRENAALSKSGKDLATKITALEAQLQKSKADIEAAVERAEAAETLLTDTQAQSQAEANAALEKVKNADALLKDADAREKETKIALDIATEQINKLIEDLNERQASLEEVTSDRTLLQKQIKDQDGVRSNLERQLKSVSTAVSDKDELQAEIQTLQEQLTGLQTLLKHAEDAYLPSWSHPYYDQVLEQAKKLNKFHREEIMTGRAYAKSKQHLERAYKTSRVAMDPYLQKAWAVAGPSLMQAYGAYRAKMRWLRQELNKPPYKQYVDKLGEVFVAVESMASNMGKRALELWNSNEVKTVQRTLAEQKMKLEKDINKIYTHALGADVAGSGIDADFVNLLVQVSLYGIPLLLFLPLYCLRRTKKAPVPTVKVPIHTGKGKKSGKRK